MYAEEFRDLVAGCSEEQLADYLQVNLKTFRRWKRGTTKAPHSAVIALRLHLGGELAALGGPDWQGFTLQGGKLHAPSFHRPFDPFQIQAMFFEVQLSRHYQREVRRLERELQQLNAEAWAAGKVREAVRASERAWRG